MQADRISHNTRGIEDTFEILYHDENQRYNNRMQPIAPLKSSNKNGWHPADNYPDVRDHRKDDNEQTNQRRKIEPDERQSGADKDAIHQTNKQLSPKISGDVLVDLRQCFRDFVLERRRAQRQVIFPSFFNARLFG